MTKQNNQQIALVDNNDNVTGYAGKLEVHEKGLLHRAFSVFVFNHNNELLMQQRADHKYHSPGLWTNTCCSHLLKGMEMEECVHDRLEFEMGFDCEVEFQFSFTYHATFGNGLTEHETDHVYFAKWNGEPNPNPDEAKRFKWISMEKLREDMAQNPENYTYWFKHIMNNHGDKLP